MQFAFHYTLEDINEVATSMGSASQAVEAQPVNRQKQFRSGVYLLLAGALHWLLLAAPLACIGLFAAVLVYLRIKWIPAASRRRDPDLQQAQSIEFSPTGVSLQGPLSRTEWKWSTFEDVTETANLLLFGLITRLILIFPKRAVPDEKQLEDLRDLLRSNIHRVAGFSVIPVSSAQAD